MRRFIVDTDTASDDAAALMIAVLSKEIDLLGVTIVAGNVGLEQAADNALMTLEVCGSEAPVYLGAKRPLFRERHETISVHGKDGMGDCDIIHPKRSPEEKRAVEFILEQVERYPNEVELIALGPATNIALAILTDREIMSKVKHIWSMGTPGFGSGNATPVSEFNVFIDAEAYALMLDLEIPVVPVAMALMVPVAIIPVVSATGTLVDLILEVLAILVALVQATVAQVIMATLQICQKTRCICVPQPITSTINIMPKL